MRRRPLLALPLLALAAPARAVRRQVDEPALSLELPDHWVPIPRAEILEAQARGRQAGADASWTVQAAWQPPPHLRWFAIPHLVLEAQPAPGQADTAPRMATQVGRAGARSIHTHRAQWVRGEQTLRLTLLAFDDQAAVFDALLSSLRYG